MDDDDKKVLCHGCYKTFLSNRGLFLHFRVKEGCKSSHDEYMRREKQFALMGSENRVIADGNFGPTTQDFENNDAFDCVNHHADLEDSIPEKEDYWDDCVEEEYDDISCYASEAETSGDDDDLIRHSDNSSNLPHKSDDVECVDKNTDVLVHEARKHDSAMGLEYWQGAVLPCSYGPELDRHIPESSLTARENAAISLMQRVRSHKVSLLLYDNTIQWMDEDLPGYNCGSFPKLPRERELLNKIRRLFPNCAPSKTHHVEVKLGKKTNETTVSLPVVTFDVFSQIRMMLNDPGLMLRENLVITIDRDELLPYQPNTISDEIQDGKVYQSFLKDHYSSGEASMKHDLVVGLVEYVDKTHTEAMGRYNVEPVVCTLSIFNRKTRENARAWFILGYITQLKQTSSKNITLPQGKLSEVFHKQMEIIHQELALAQSRVWMDLRIDHKRFRKRLILPLLMVQGDGPGNDYYCGRYVNYSENSGRICWKCDCKPEMADSYHVDPPEIPTCTFLDNEKMRLLVSTAILDKQASNRNEAMLVLKKISQQPTMLHVWNSSLLLADNTNGLFGLCNTCVLHAFDQGIVPKVLETIFFRLVPSMKERVDHVLCKSLFRVNVQSHVQELFWRTSFPSLCSITRTTGKEKLGLLFCWAIVVRTGIGASMLTMGNYARISSSQSFFDNSQSRSLLYFGKDSELETFGRVLEFMLCYERHIMVPGLHLWDANSEADSVRKCEMELERKTAIMMSCIFWVFPKPITSTTGHYLGVGNIASDFVEMDGAGETGQEATSSWGGQKIHLLYHIPREITNHGVMSNSDTSVGEKHHRFWAKMPANVTSKRGTETFGHEVGKRMEEAILIQHASCKIPELPTKVSTLRRNVDTLVDKGTKYYIQLRELPKAIIKDDSTLKKKKYRTGDFPIPTQVLHYVYLQYLYYDGQLLCSTELVIPQQCHEGNKENLVVRCHPCFNGHCSYDWVWVRSSAILPNQQNLDFDCSNVPAQIACVVLGHQSSAGKFTQWTEAKIVVRPACISAGDNGRSCRSFLLKRYQKAYSPSGDPMFVTIKRADIVGQCICFEDFPSPFHAFDDFQRERDLFFEQYISKSHSRIQKIRFLTKDWVYAVTAKTEWPWIFNEMTLGRGHIDDGVGYRPPDKDDVTDKNDQDFQRLGFP